MPVPTDRTSTSARRFAAAIEPVVGQVYFSPECHERYAALGFQGSPGKAGAVALPDGAAYFTSRGSLMGQVPGQLVAAAFAVFNPAVVVPAVSYGWTLTDAATICAEREAGAVGQLARILGDRPDGLEQVIATLERAAAPLSIEGRPLAAGARSRLPGDDPLAHAWRLGDFLREYRGDSHTIAWVSAGFSPVEIGLLTELFWGLPLRSYIRTRAWSDAELDEAEAGLIAGGLVADGRFTEAGHQQREAVEVETDRQMGPAIGAMGEDLDATIPVLQGWGEQIRAAGGYLTGAGDLTGAR